MWVLREVLHIACELAMLLLAWCAFVSAGLMVMLLAREVFAVLKRSYVDGFLLIESFEYERP